MSERDANVSDSGTADEATGGADPPDRLPVAGVALAGGLSRRFGEENKALAILDGEALVSRVVGTIAAVTDRTPIVSVRDESQRAALADALADANPRYVTDGDQFDGPVAGVAAASAAADAAWLFIAGCDMPLLSEEAVRWLWSRRDPDADAVAFATGEHAEPLHAFYRRSSVGGALSSLPREAGLHALLAELGDVQTVPVEDAPDGIDVEASLTNVNTKAELAALVER